MNDYFDLCIKQAQLASDSGDVPIGAVIVKDSQVISYSHNTREHEHDIIGHAEINAIRNAEKILGRWNLSDCDLYVTLEPCSMCKEIIQQARIAHVFYLVSKLDYKKEYNKTSYVILSNNETQKNEQMYKRMLSQFFQAKR